MPLQSRFLSTRTLGTSLLLAASVIAPVAHPQAGDPVPPSGRVVSSEPTEPSPPPEARPATPVSDAERSSVAILSLSLDIHLTPADAHEEAHATLTLRNTANVPLTRIPLQLSSTLRWLAISSSSPAGLVPVPFTQSPIHTDADHTGYAEEAVLTPASPLAPGADLRLSVFLSGTIAQSSDRLELVGAPHKSAAEADWDAIVPTSDSAATALRGFGDVLWYPVAAPSALLGSGNDLPDLVARERLRNAAVSMALRLTVDYLGDPPDSVLFNGVLKPLDRTPDADTQLVSETHGIATASFPSAPIGFRVPSLFLTAQHAIGAADRTLTVITAHPEAVKPYADAAANVTPFLSAWLGKPSYPGAILLDHPGAPYQDGAFLATPLDPGATAETAASDLIRPMAHAALRDPLHPAGGASSAWIDQGLAEFLAVVLSERSEGREAALARLRHASVLIALAEPAGTEASPSQPLTRAHADVFLRLKAAFVFWQLRELLGEPVLQKGLAAFLHRLSSSASADRDPANLQKTLEQVSGKDLAWFFNDWVYADAGLPDLTIVSANPRPLPARAGKNGGVILAVEVRNDGDAVADVPVTVRSGTLSASERLRIPAHASASTRILFEGQPEAVEVNDGSVPELRTTTHTLNFGGRP